MRTFIELDSQAFTYNCLQIKKAIGQTELALVIKGNAYGHGMKEIALLCEHTPTISWLCTAGLSEALSLRMWGIRKHILALSYIDAPYELAVSHDIHCALYTYEDAYALNQAAQRLQKQAFVHIKVDTGMSRLGILPDDIYTFVQAIRMLPFLTIYGIFTHLGDTSNSDPSFSYKQLEQFDTIVSHLEQGGIKLVCTHTQSSSGLCITPKHSYTLARIGALAYGLWKSYKHKELTLRTHPDLTLFPVMAWKTHIIQLKSLPVGSVVGYDRTATVQHPTTIALLPVGYWDGYCRSLSNKGHVLIRGQKAPVLGIVSMNLTTVDVTHIPDVTLKDEVILLGNSQSITANVCAEKAGIITNDLMSHIHHDIPRIIIPEIEQSTFKQVYKSDVYPL
jgi:alanine racemase